MAAPGPTPAWPSLVGGLSVWCRPQSLGLASVGCSGGCPEGPPLISHRSRWVLGPPTLAGLGLRDPWLQGAQGCPWNPREQRGGREAGSRWARRGGGHSLHPSPSPLRARGVLGVREGWPFRSSRARPGDSVLRGTEGPRSSSLFPSPLSRLPRGQRGPRRGHGHLRRGWPCPWLQQQRLVLGFGGCVCAPALGARAPSDAGYVSTPPTAGSWELPRTAVSRWAPRPRGAHRVGAHSRSRSRPCPAASLAGTLRANPGHRWEDQAEHCLGVSSAPTSPRAAE